MTAHATALPSGRKILPVRAVAAKTLLSRTVIYRMMGKGTFPKPIKFGRMSVWLESEVDDWIEARIAERDRQAA